MTQLTTTKNEPKSLMGLLSSPSFKQQLMAVLPKTMTPDRLVRIAMTEIRMNPKLMECDPMSFAGAIMRCAQLGLEPSSERQHIHLIPFKNNKMNRTECQVIVGFRGFLSLALKSNVYIESDVVYQNDHFDFQKGLDTKCSLTPAIGQDRGEVIGAYAMARICLPDQTIVFIPEFMSKFDIDKIMMKAKYSSSPDSPWRQHYDSMARKTVIRKLFKYVPISAEIDTAVNVDELGDREAQNNADLLKENINDLINEPEEKSSADKLADNLESKIG
jgi:recombination protein RecT